MAMPASGCIALRTCIVGCACSSISCAVAGIACSPACLSTLSTQAGKSAPHGMREFYSYVPKTAINWTTYTSYGTNGVSSYTYRYNCATPTPSAGQTYSLCVTGDLCTLGQQAGSWARICVTCNNVHKMCCCIGANLCGGNFGVLFTVDSTDCVRACNHACATNTACQGASGPGSKSCIYSVTGTYHCKGTTCPLIYTYTA